MKALGSLTKHGSVSHIRNHFLSVRSKPVSHRMRLSIKEVFQFLNLKTVLSFRVKMICKIDVYKMLL